MTDNLTVGTRVKIVAEPDNAHKVGDLGTITTVRENRTYTYVVNVNGGDGYYKRSEIEPVAPTHPALPPHGMTSAQLGQYVDEFISAAVARVNGVGADQYATSEGQKFEGMPLLGLVEYAREEVQDLAAYAAMVDIRLGRLAVELRNATASVSA